MTAALETGTEAKMEFEGASPADLAVMESQLQAARAANPELFEPDNDAEDQAAATSDEPPGEQAIKATNDAAPSAGTVEDTEQKTADQRPQTEDLKAADAAVKAEADKAAAEAAKTDPNAKPASKFAKNAERLDKTWKAVNERKAALEQQAAEFKAQQEAFARERTEWEAKLAQSQPQHTPDEYEAAAKHYEQRGQLEFADAMRAEAKRLRENPPKAATPKAAAQELEQGQRASWQQVKAEIPEMFDAKHPLNAEMRAWLEQHGAKHPLMKLPEGPHLIAHHLKAQADLRAERQVSSRVPGLEKQLAELKAKNQELEQLVSVEAGGAGRLSSKPRGIEDMSDDEAEAYLKAEARRLGV